MIAFSRFAFKILYEERNPKKNSIFKKIWRKNVHKNEKYQNFILKVNSEFYPGWLGKPKKKHKPFINKIKNKIEI